MALLDGKKHILIQHALQSTAIIEYTIGRITETFSLRYTKYIDILITYASVSALRVHVQLTLLI